MVQRTVRRTSVRARGLALMVTVLALGGSWLVAPTTAQSAAVAVGYRDFSYSTSITAPTGQKPESKLWYNDGTWWGVLWNASVSPKRLEIYRFNLSTQATNAWTPTGTVVDSRRNAEADVLWSGGKLYVLTHMKDTDTSATDLGLKFQRFGYSTTSKKYAFEVSKTVVNKKAEAAVLDRDSTGKLWVTYTTENTSGGREVRVAHSTDQRHHLGHALRAARPGCEQPQPRRHRHPRGLQGPARGEHGAAQDRRALEQRERRDRQRAVLRQPQGRVG